MNVYTLVGVVLGPFAIVYVLVTRHSIRAMRAGDEEWRQRWRELPPEHRKAILGRMRSGQPVEREDAELSIRAARQVEHVRKAIRPITLASGAVLVFIFVAGVVSGAVGFVVCGAAGLGLGLVFELLARHQQRRYRESVTATRQLVEE